PGARPGPVPKDFGPQLATLVDVAPRGPGWVHEIKLDGYRILAFVDGARVRLMSRNDKEWTPRFPEVVDALADLGVRAVIDGEVVAFGANGAGDFQALQNAMRAGAEATLAYFAFDLPWYEGVDLRGASLLDRKRLLERLVASAGASPTLFYSPHGEGEADEILKHACDRALEGLVSKRAEGRYVSRRTRDWVKVKCGRRQEFVVGGYSAPGGARVGFGSLLLGVYDGDALKVAGRVGTGFDDAALRHLLKRMKPLRRATPPFVDPPRGADARGVTWIEPKLVVEVEFLEWTREGSLRHPSFVALREDKDPREIRRERATPVEKVEASEPEAPVADSAPRTRRRGAPPASAVDAERPPGRPPAAPKTRSGERIDVAGVSLSNPDRVLFRDPQLTKLDVARYYVAVADRILPHVVNRPLAVVRCPEGEGKECFFQKHVTTSTPKAIASVKIEEKEGEIEDCLMIRDLEGLVALVQMGVLEIHPWGSRADDPELPDRIVFDLDPGPGVPWARMAEAARQVRDALGALGLAAFLKSTGGKGLHVVAPLKRKAGWDEVKEFSRGIALGMERADPGGFVSKMTKSRREGRIFVDYLRNGRGATSVAAWSTRARPGAQVSMPLRWDELTDEKADVDFDVARALERLRSRRADPWKDLEPEARPLTASMMKAVAAAARGS
ncbi:MAG TPA: DNA ligase D, partial [Planctomycetota bacterium]|nr:DNA ligase D [Planctomycetota bacterium]